VIWFVRRLLPHKATLMEDGFQKKMKTSLLSLKQEILKNLASESEDFRTIIENMDPKDLADIAADDIDRKTLEALGTQELRRLQLIESALARIENDKYGLCARCSKKIPRERLEAIPYALLCIECKSSEERRNR
jgi:DnaK suppressor protein